MAQVNVVVGSWLTPRGSESLSHVILRQLIDATAALVVPGLSGNTLTIGHQGSTTTVNGAPLITPELDAVNGIVHPMAAVPAPAS